MKRPQSRNGKRGNSESVAVSKQDFQIRKQKNYFLVMVYSALISNIIKALNLILEKFVEEI